MNCQLLHGDCLELMRNMPSGSVDAVVCDLPYGTTACSWDVVIPFAPLWVEYKRVAKPSAAIVLFCTQPFTTALIASNMSMFKYCWAWKKSQGSNFVHAPNMPLKVLEDVAVFSGGNVAHASLQPAQRITYNPQGVRAGTRSDSSKNTSGLRYSRPGNIQHAGGTYAYKNENYPHTLLKFQSERGLHPTQKPVALLEYLIKTYTNEGETVLDNCMGSGTCGVACANANRHFIGMELDANYYNIARNRIESTQPLLQAVPA